MHFSALISALFALIAFISSFLLMFAGSSQGFMEDFALVTLNTSRIGYNVFNSSEPTDTDNIFANIFNGITNEAEKFVEGSFNSLAKEIGIRDFYAAHILTYCEGYYNPQAVPNDTIPRSQIHMETTYCSRRTATFYFNPTAIVQAGLDNSGHSNIRLQDLKWPRVVEEGFHNLRTIARLAFAFYCISICFSFIALITSGVSTFTDRPPTTIVNLSANALACSALLMASAFATIIALQSTSLLNQNLTAIGAESESGKKFLALTWASTALLMISNIILGFNCVSRHKTYLRSLSKI